MTGPRTTVVLAEDDVLLREGIADLLEQAGFDVIGQAGTGMAADIRVGAYA